MYFEFVGGNLALDFANTVHSHGLADPRDDLKTGPDLMAWGAQAGLVGERDREGLWRRARSQAGTTELQRARKLREVIYQLFAGVARAGRPAPEMLYAFNPFVREAMTRARIQKSGEKYELGCDHRVRPLDRLRFEVTRAAMELLTSGKLDRVRQCSGETCSWLFLDTSRNGTRRWCDMQACGNRAKVRRFRQHQSSDRKA